MSFAESEIARHHFAEIEQIAVDAMGSSYRAVDQRLGKQVLVRALDATLPAEEREAERARMQQEARVASRRRISSPQILEAYGFDEDAAQGSAYLYLEYVEHVSLASQLSQEPRLPEHTALLVTCDLVRAIAAHWESALVHRNITPETLLLLRDEQVRLAGAKLTGYGIALDLRSTQHTQMGAFQHPGKPGYRSPEQQSSSRLLTAASDLYNVGLLLWEMLAGEPRHRYQNEPVTTAGFSASLQTTAIVRRALEQEQSQRYTRPEQLLSDLESAIASLTPTRMISQPVLVDPANSGERSRIPFPESEIARKRFAEIELIGQGAFANVYRAMDRSLKRQIAIKEISLALPSMDREAVLLRFQQEARIVAQLETPHVVRVFDYDEDNQYLYLEYVRDGSLADLLRTSKILPEQTAIMLARDVVRAIDAHWSNNIVHRDIKPSNILLVRDKAGALSGAKLADYGVAQDMDSTQRTRTSGNAHPGTPSYMSPEQESSVGALMAASDLYNVGLLLWEMLAGEPRFRYKWEPIASGKFKATPELTRIIERALEPDLQRRYRQPAELLQDLEDLLVPGSQPSARTTPGTKPGTKPGKKGPATQPPKPARPLTQPPKASQPASQPHGSSGPALPAQAQPNHASEIEEQYQLDEQPATRRRWLLPAALLGLVLALSAVGGVVLSGGATPTSTPTSTIAPASSTPSSTSAPSPTTAPSTTRAEPTRTASPSQTGEPSATATAEPSASAEPSATAPAPRATTRRPTARPTAKPTARPTAVPTAVPPTGTATAVLPTEVPTAVPPTDVPTEVPTAVPPTDVPTEVPTEEPTEPPPPPKTKTPTPKPPPSS